ncbi:hypothetical protein M0R04_05535 [Candidatus Dojkabacteria bacterium]|jgi:hypothetical protein|nr:hypothetical protein [Candidatus Dojkabacteria bacterium]
MSHQLGVYSWPKKENKRIVGKKVFRKARRLVYEKLDYEELKKCCEAPVKTLMELTKGHNKTLDYGFMNNNSNILGVAHLDTVQQSCHFAVVNSGKRKLIFCPKLDDRIGVYTLLYLLPKLGVNIDILFSNDEERGASTASRFKTDKKYNWMVEFDRRGDDAVTYRYRFDDVVEKHFIIGVGSYSDISSMSHLGCMGFNVGVGYSDEHSINAYMDVEMYINQIAYFLLFYQSNKDTFYEHKEVAYTHRGSEYCWGEDNIHDYVGGYHHNRVNTNISKYREQLSKAKHSRYNGVGYWCKNCNSYLKNEELECCEETEAGEVVCPICYLEMTVI